jgi:D-alanyl-D-alanine carboxypeptidase
MLYPRKVLAFVTVFAAVAAGIAIVVAGPAPAVAADKSAAMVIDANTGKVLYARNADAKRYPASLTKMMTIFMVFDEIRAGRLTFDSRITMSKVAAQRPPSKLGLKPGRSLSVKDAIRALVTKSANDVAAAVGERIAGSEWRFAIQMTKRARQLGMTSTTFKNASGLPDSNQTTTARDMLKLALALQDIYPEYFHLFSLRSFHYGGKTYRNHNSLLRSMRGVDGIKTGYTRASGFNLVTSMRHDRRHIVGAVFGGRTAGRRNARMRSLLYTALKKASRKKTRRSSPMLIAKPAKAPRPAQRPVQKPKTFAATTPKIQPAKATPRTPSGARFTVARVKPVSVLAGPAPSPIARQGAAGSAQPQTAGRGRAPSTLAAQAANLNSRQYASLEPAAARKPAYRLNGPSSLPPVTAPAQVTQRRRNGPFQIQVGAFRTAAEAERHVQNLKSGMRKTLAGYAPLTLPAVVSGKQYWRVRFAGFDASSATQTCHELRRSSVDCFVAKAP